MSESLEHSEDDRALAGEYLLGLLSAEEAAAFAARLEREPALAALVADWAESLVPFAEEIEPVSPPVRVKAAIDARLFAAERKSPFGRLRGAFAGLALAASLVLAAFFFTGQSAPDYVAEIAAEDATLVVAARYYNDTGYLELNRTEGGPAQGRALELWLIEGDNPPVSLGVLPEAERSIFVVDTALRARVAGAVLAVSDEPEGGSPTGAPTGAVLAVGAMEDA